MRLGAFALDPDGDAVDLRWWQYHEADSYAGQVAIDGANSRHASLTVPDDAAPGDTIHVILDAKDDGTPSITRYQRVVITVCAPRTNGHGRPRCARRGH